MSHAAIQKHAEKWLKLHESGNQSEAQALQSAIELLIRMKPPRRSPLELPEQPFDRNLLMLSPLFRRSRKRYLDSGGQFQPALISTLRSLASPTLLIQKIAYSPIECELRWAAAEHLMAVRAFTSNLFHEQSHRLLWKLLPPPPRDRDGVRRYLNFAESLVIATDMALGDELGLELGRIFSLTGVIYDAGTDVKRAGLSRRMYRDYLHAAAYATYLGLELYSDDGIEQAVRMLYPLPEELCEHATWRAGKLDHLFIAITNPDWQDIHWKKVARELSVARKGKPLELPEDRMDHRLAYLWAEKWFERMGL